LEPRRGASRGRKRPLSDCLLFRTFIPEKQESGRWNRKGGERGIIKLKNERRRTDTEWSNNKGMKRTWVLSGCDGGRFPVPIESYPIGRNKSERKKARESDKATGKGKDKEEKLITAQHEAPVPFVAASPSKEASRNVARPPGKSGTQNRESSRKPVEAYIPPLKKFC